MADCTLQQAEVQCLAALETAYADEMAFDVIRVKVELARVCMIHGLSPRWPAGFCIEPVPVAKINDTFQWVTKRTMFHETKLQTVLQHPALRECFQLVSLLVYGSQKNALLMHLPAVLPKASQSIRSLLPDLAWLQPAAPAYTPSPASTSAPSPNRSTTPAVITLRRSHSARRSRHAPASTLLPAATTSASNPPSLGYLFPCESTMPAATASFGGSIQQPSSAALSMTASQQADAVASKARHPAPVPSFTAGNVPVHFGAAPANSTAHSTAAAKAPASAVSLQQQEVKPFGLSLALPTLAPANPPASAGLRFGSPNRTLPALLQPPSELASSSIPHFSFAFGSQPATALPQSIFGTSEASGSAAAPTAPTASQTLLFTDQTQPVSITFGIPQQAERLWQSLSSSSKAGTAAEPAAASAPPVNQAQSSPLLPAAGSLIGSAAPTLQPRLSRLLLPADSLVGSAAPAIQPRLSPSLPAVRTSFGSAQTASQAEASTSSPSRVHTAAATSGVLIRDRAAQPTLAPNTAETAAAAAAANLTGEGDRLDPVQSLIHLLPHAVGSFIRQSSRGKHAAG